MVFVWLFGGYLAFCCNHHPVELMPMLCALAKTGGEKWRFVGPASWRRTRRNSDNGERPPAFRPCVARLFAGVCFPLAFVLFFPQN